VRPSRSHHVEIGGVSALGLMRTGVSALPGSASKMLAPPWVAPRGASVVDGGDGVEVEAGTAGAGGGA
jgi:hypothetical protein